MPKKELNNVEKVITEEQSLEKTSQEEKPKYRSHLHEGYWFEVGKRLVDNSELNINTSAEKFEKLILWFWGVYTSIVGLGAGGFTIFLGKSISIITLVGMILPSVILLIAYWLTTAASTSAIVSFEHRSPDSIREAFMEGLREKGRYYNLARIFAFLACLFIPVTIFLANRVQSGDFEVLRIKSSLEQYSITLSGIVPKSSRYEVSIFAEDKTISRKGETDTGHFVEEILIPMENKSVKIRLWWTESDGKGATKEKEIELNKNDK
ncbi:MAG: hypothetical protein SFU98_07220 [Leptospiraceae bacterium]|nr:hypothetical protein [Leptospiraceae bacterium]